MYEVFEFPLHTLHLLYSREMWTTHSIAVLCIPLDCRIRTAGRCTAPQTADGRHSRHIATVTIFIQQKRIRKCGSLCKTFSEYSQRERDHSHSSIHPPKHQFRAWKMSFCCCRMSLYDFKIPSIATAELQHGFATCDMNRGTASCVNWPEN